jgi:hypothetical protein
MFEAFLPAGARVLAAVSMVAVSMAAAVMAAAGAVDRSHA